MMSEKRFKMGESDIQGEMIFIDTQTNKIYWQEYFDEIVDLVNEQQATIQRFEEYVFSDEKILCYNCLFCQEKDIYEVKCKIKGSVDVHGTCQYYKKKGDE